MKSLYSMSIYSNRFISYLYHNSNFYVSLKTKPWRVFVVGPGHREQRAELSLTSDESNSKASAFFMQKMNFIRDI